MYSSPFLHLIPFSASEVSEFGQRISQWATTVDAIAAFVTDRGVGSPPTGRVAAAAD
jgi:hypothetical protein